MCQCLAKSKKTSVLTVSIKSPKLVTALKCSYNPIQESSGSAEEEGSGSAEEEVSGSAEEGSGLHFKEMMRPITLDQLTPGSHA